MTFNNENNGNYDLSLASEHWLDAYNTNSTPDLESFDTFSSQFLEQVNNPDIDAANLIGNLCLFTFSAVAFSSMVKYRGGGADETEMEEIPVLTIILHPFKESRLGTFGKKESLFGVLVNNKNPKVEAKPIEFLKPLNLFEAWKPTIEDEPGPKTTGENLMEDGILTPSFNDFFDETFHKGVSNNEPYQPLNNATEMKPSSNGTGQHGEDEDQGDTQEPKPVYRPRKAIPLSPAMVRIIFEQREYNFDGIINGIREHAWSKVKSLKKEESRKKYLYLTYRTLQALWTHGQQEADNGPDMAKFIRCEAKSVATVTTFKWAVDKMISMTEALALSLGNLKDMGRTTKTRETRSPTN
jgi:hypothetical protein